jgi:hypothetical protein
LVYGPVAILSGLHTDAKEELVGFIDGLRSLTFRRDLSLAGVGLKDAGFGIQPVDARFWETQLETLVGQENGMTRGCIVRIEDSGSLQELYAGIGESTGDETYRAVVIDPKKHARRKQDLGATLFRAKG